MNKKWYNTFFYYSHLDVLNASNICNSTNCMRSNSLRSRSTRLNQHRNTFVYGNRLPIIWIGRLATMVPILLIQTQSFSLQWPKPLVLESRYRSPELN
ncbi:conserved hypothetical protein [Ricinus communis]|uniref:Uncharacterized protein n=1 Tax=Ricinus communis TaxID=3988 RepID=B9RPM5_RICCO|nr:conserved hypothetical protein [Ricinus communis]